MAIKVDTNQYLDKWARRSKAATQDVRQGIERVTEAPGVKAAQNADRMAEGIMQAINSGKWQRAVAGVSLEAWKRKTIEVGIPRIASGVDASLDKNRAKIDQLLQDVAAAQVEVDRMPSTSFQDRVQRSVRFQEIMHEKAQSGR